MGSRPVIARGLPGRSRCSAEFLGVIDEILIADRNAPAKQRHTAKRIFERLRDEHGYTGCCSQVRAEVAAARRRHKEVFVPLSHPPGEAQYDLGEAVVVPFSVIVQSIVRSTSPSLPDTRIPTP